uniref:SdrD B-like domain-containing protein n=1 Tax=Pseudactinotalea sp. TaxID=1926260 RepID=UPI003B3B8F0F
ATGVDFSFHVPTAYVENNPRVYIPILQYGVSDGESAAMPGSGVILWDAESASGAGAAPVPQTGVVPFSEIGATNGSAMTRADSIDDVPTVFAAAYLRRHIGFGPGGIGAIYRVTPDGADWSAPTASADVYVNVADWGIDLGGPDISADPTDPNGFRPNVTADNPDYDWLRDAQAWNDVGRAGLGLISMSPDERYIFAVNLHNRSLIRIDTGGNPAGTPVSVQEFELDAYFPDSSDIRPYGVSVDALTGTMYITATNTAETSQDVADLHGYVYSFDAETPGTLTEVLDFPLDFERGGYSETFFPWATEIGHYPAGTEMRYDMPVVASVQILHGDLIVAIRDLVGDIFGTLTNLSGDPTDGDTRMVTHVRSEGDVFIAAPNGDGTFTLENNGVHNGVLGNGAQQGDQGPGGLRYFDTGYTPLNQDNESTGSVVVMPSRPDGIMTTGVHVANAGLQEGTRRLYQATGAGYDPSGALIRRTDTSQVTSKGNGLGTASVLASAAPIEIGNYVWYDIDNDGIQDPDEPPVEGATVNLYEVDGDGNRTWVSSTTTSALGEYYFSSDPTLNENGYALQTNTDYVVGIDNPDDYAAGGPLENWYPTIPDTGDTSSVDADRNDSDGLVEETPDGWFPFAAITTGGPGENDHTIDFGYSNIDYEFDKRTVSGPTENPDDDGTWVLEYELVAENIGMIDGSYGLTDDLTGYGEGIVVVDTEVVSGPAGAALNPDWDGVDDQRVITADQPIAAQSTIDNGTEHVYLIRVTVALATDADTGEATATPEALTCTDGQAPGDATTGLFNVATMEPNNHEDLVDNECGDLPLVTLDKSVTVEPHVVDPIANPGEYEITYGLTVTNETTTATDYDLQDRLRFGQGITIVEGSVSSENVTPGGVATNPAYDGVGDSFIVTDEPIGASEVHTYTVTVRYTVDLPDAGTVDPDPSACGDANGADGADPTGLYNDANTSFNGYPSYDDECREVGEVTHDKSLISATPIGNGQWEVVYGIEVTNKGVEPVGYDLADELHFGEGITVAATEVTSVPDGVTPADPAWDGQDNLTVTTGVTIAGSDDPDYAPHEYVLTVIADVPLQLPDPVDGIDPATCGDAGAGAVDDTDRAFNNVSTLTDEAGAVEEDDACAGPPEFAIVKTVADDSPVAGGDGTWTVSYEITVTNTGGLEGEYDVSDRLRFGDGIDVVSSSIQAPSGVATLDTWTGEGVEGAEENLLAADVALAAGETHTYTVDVVVAIDEAGFGSDSLTCAEPGSGGAGGLSNVAGLGHNDLTDEADACVTIEPQVSLDKTIASGPVTDDDGGYTITYQIEVTNTGGLPTSYVLSDELRFGAGIDVTDVEVSNETPGDVPVLGSFTGLGEAGSAENRITGDVPIAIDAVHVYLVEVTGTIDVSTATLASLECAEDTGSGTGSGLLNVATVDHAGDQLTDDACAPLDPPPGADLPDTGANGVGTAALVAGLLTILGGALVVARAWHQRAVRRELPIP